MRLALDSGERATRQRVFDAGGSIVASLIMTARSGFMAPARTMLACLVGALEATDEKAVASSFTFEAVRRNRAAQDPITYLPSLPASPTK